MRWADLKPKVQWLAQHNEAPRAILVHLGGNDLGQTVGCCLEHAIKQDLAFIQCMFPKCKIIFSQVVPRLVWTQTEIPPRKIEIKRRHLNRCARRLVINLLKGIYVAHPDITTDTPGFYLPDGVHLSDVGLDLFTLSLTEALQSLQ